MEDYSDFLEEALLGIDEWLFDYYEQKKKRDQSFFVNLTLKSPSPEVKILANSYAPQIVDFFKKELNRKRVSKSLVLKNLSILILNRLANKKPYFVYSRSKAFYQSGYYNPQKISYTFFTNFIEALEKLGLVEDHIIALRSKAKDRKASRFKLSKDLTTKISLLKLKDVPRPTDIVLVRDSEKQLVELKNHKNKIKKVEHSLNLINQTIEAHEYSVNGESVGKPFLRRIYNNGKLTYGGRFYAYGSFPTKPCQKCRDLKLQLMVLKQLNWISNVCIPLFYIQWLVSNLMRIHTHLVMTS